MRGAAVSTERERDTIDVVRDLLEQADELDKILGRPVCRRLCQLSMRAGMQVAQRAIEVAADKLRET